MNVADVPALNQLTVREMIDATPLGPILDRPVGEVLAGLGLPALPQIPALPPLPGLPPLPTLDLTLLIKPMTDLLGGFGTGDLSGAAFDPSAVFANLSKVLEMSMSMGSGALKALDKVWTGTASVAAVGKSAQATADTGRVAAQGTGMSIDIQAAAGIVAAGLATVQGIIAATVGKLFAAAPLLATPGGQALLLGFATEGLAEATAAVAATRAQLLGPTTTMAVNGAPVPVTNAPAPGAAGPSPFAVAGSVLDAITPVVSTMGQLPSAIAAPVGKMLTAAHPHGPQPVMPTGSPLSHNGNGPTGGGPAGGGPRVRPAGGGAGGVPGALSMPVTLTARLSAAPIGMTEPASSGPQQTARPITATTGAMTPAMSPMGLAGTARGAAAPNESHGVPDYLVTENNGRRVVGDDAQVAPAVFGDDSFGAAQPPAIIADIELRLGPITGTE